MKVSKEKKFSQLFYNAVTYLGVMISLLVAVVEVFLFALDFFDKGRNLYLGLVTYLILPVFLIFGLLLIPVGVLWKRWRIHRGLSPVEFRRFRIDLAIPQHRNALLVFIIGTSAVVVMTMMGAYKGFHYTESVKFCGALCHKVMNPEYTAYKHSPHAKIKCVECHIGAGADWYVRSKMSGARQVLKTLTNTYELPIKTPVHNLRPAEETCKECHWPGKFFGSVEFKRSYFLSEEDNPRWNIRMLVNVGGGQDQSYGVHAHMNLDHDIYYVADDERRQQISWVKSVDKAGREVIYTTEDSAYKDRAPSTDKIRKMDCIDCHNRPSHQFESPYRLLNDAMQYGRLDATLPLIKDQGMKLLSKKYESTDEAAKAIRQILTGFYQNKYPELYSSQKQKIEKAIEQITKLYTTNMFPEMKTRWDTHPNNLGHLVAPGCFRCHDNEHKTSGGQVISKDCKSCHMIVEQGAPGAIEKNIDGLEFKHPVDISEAWKEMNCTECHTGGA